MTTKLSDLREALPKVAGLCLGQEDEAVDLVVAAARRFLALTETGRRVEWCEIHEAVAPIGQNECGVAYWMGPNYQPDCHIVSKVLADYLTEEE